jgi:eukaryotic-like serine/threonine-protein kinase
MTVATPADWEVLSPYLDQALDLAPEERERWLAGMTQTQPDIATALRDMLARHAALDASGFLSRPLLDSKGDLAQRLAGQRCGAWTLLEPLGAGGMGSVWLAERSDGRYEGRAAIKLPHAALLAWGDARRGAERFEREGRLLARLAHPNIAALLDAGIAATGQPYLVLEFVQGEPITAWCDAHSSSIDDRVALLLEVIDAVAYAHRQLVLHRDLKPANILVDTAGRVKLLDFGIAKMIEADQDTGVVGAAATQIAFTPDHAAPEQLQGMPMGTGTDVYALGVLLYQLLTGRHPTAEPAQSHIERLRAVVEKEPLPMSEVALRVGRALRGDLDTIAAKALRKSPTERYADAAALADDLRRWRAGLPVLAQPDTALYRLSRFVRRHRAGVAASVAGLTLLLAALGVTIWQAQQVRQERDAARWQAERAFARSNVFNLALGSMGSLDEPLTQRRVLESSLQLIEQHYAAQPKLAVELLLPIAGQFYTLGDVKSDLAVMQRAAELAQASGSAELVAMVACSTVDTRIAHGQPEVAAALVRDAEVAMATMIDPPQGLQVSCAVGKAMAARALGQGKVALVAAEAALQLLQAQAGSRQGNMYPLVLGVLTKARRDSGDMAGAFAAAEDAVAVAREAGGADSLSARTHQRGLALLMIEAGEIVPAHRLLQQAVAGWPGDGPPPYMLLTLADAQLRLGDATAAITSVELARQAAARIASTEFDEEMHFVLAQAARQQGRFAAARRHLQMLGVSAQEHHALELPHTPGSEQALLQLAEGQSADALLTINVELQRLATAEARPAQHADAWLAAARIALAVGQPERARDSALAALEAATRSARNPAASVHVRAARELHAQAVQLMQR